MTLVNFLDSRSQDFGCPIREVHNPLKLFELDWLDLNFRNQENGPMSPDSVCAISASLAGDETNHIVQVFNI